MFCIYIFITKTTIHRRSYRKKKVTKFWLIFSPVIYEGGRTISERQEDVDVGKIFSLFFRLENPDVTTGKATNNSSPLGLDGKKQPFFGDVFPATVPIWVLPPGMEIKAKRPETLIQSDDGKQDRFTRVFFYRLDRVSSWGVLVG